MKESIVILHGVPHLSLLSVAQAFDVEPSWVEEVYEFGLLGKGERVDEQILIEARQIERVGAIRRLAVQQGVNLPGIAIILDLWEAAP